MKSSPLVDQETRTGVASSMIKFVALNKVPYVYLFLPFLNVRNYPSLTLQKSLTRMSAYSKNPIRTPAIIPHLQPSSPTGFLPVTMTGGRNYIHPCPEETENSWGWETGYIPLQLARQ